MGAPLELFLTGLALGVGPCMMFCLPILLPYIAGTREGWLEGLKATMAFSLTRLAAYTVLGLIAGVSGEILTGLFGEGGYSLYIWVIGYLFVSFLGLLILLGGELKTPMPRFLTRHKLGDDLTSLIILGLLVGITPCGPLLGILTYITLSVKSPLSGAFHAFCFGLGASIITPITLLGVVAGVVPRLIFKSPRISEMFKRSCGALLILLGAKQIITQLVGGPRYW